jgi:carbamoyl-phosphate synthase large subunit
MIVIEMNPRVSRSSALASKATGFPDRQDRRQAGRRLPAARTAQRHHRKTKACFEPTIDYVVTKIPRFAFEKFPEADATLTTQMKSVGETMAIGRTFKESFAEGAARAGGRQLRLGCDGKDLWGTPKAARRSTRSAPSWPRPTPNGLVPALRDQSRHVDRRDPRADGIDPWFLDQMAEIVEMEDSCAGVGTLAERRRRATLRARPSSSAFPTGSWPRSGTPARWTSASTASAGHRGHVQVGRYLRRRVRGLHAVLLLDLRGRGRTPPKSRARSGS